MSDQQKDLGQYPTPVWASEMLIERHFGTLTVDDVVVEPSCGFGSFLGAVPSHVHAVGIDIDPAMAQSARRYTGRDVRVGDFRTIDLSDVHPTVILGNPPFQMKVVDGFLERSHALLPNEGRVGFVLPAYAFQTASRVVAYAEKWSLFQEMLPRNLFNGLKLPLMFAVFTKNKRRILVGLALYHETNDMNQLAQPYRSMLAKGEGSVWQNAIEAALKSLGGRAHLQDIYRVIEGRRPTQASNWKEQIRKVVRQCVQRFRAVDDERGVYELVGAAG